MVSHKLHIKANLLHAQIEIIAKVARRLINLAQPKRGKRVAIVETLQPIEIVIYTAQMEMHKQIRRERQLRKLKNDLQRNLR